MLYNGLRGGNNHKNILQLAMVLDTRYSLDICWVWWFLRCLVKDGQYFRSHIRAKPVFFPDIVVHAYNFSMGNVEAGGLQV